MKIVTFDPGKIASYAIYDTRTPFEIEVGEVELVGVGRLLRPCGQHISSLLEGADCGLVEEVGARPGQGVSSMFTFGLCLGAILNAIGASEVQLETVTPADWKRSTRISSKSDEEVKTLARSYATQLFPQHKKIFAVKKNHGMAEAALMARWYFLKGPGRDVSPETDLRDHLSQEME